MKPLKFRITYDIMGPGNTIKNVPNLPPTILIDSLAGCLAELAKSSLIVGDQTGSVRVIKVVVEEIS